MQLKPTDGCPLRHHAPANCQLYLLSTPLPLKPGKKSSVLSVKNRAHYHSDRMTRQLLLLAKKWVVVCRTYRDVHLTGPHSLSAASDLTAVPAMLLLHHVGTLKGGNAFDEASLLIEGDRAGQFIQYISLSRYEISRSRFWIL